MDSSERKWFERVVLMMPDTGAPAASSLRLLEFVAAATIVARVCITVALVGTEVVSIGALVAAAALLDVTVVEMVGAGDVTGAPASVEGESHEAGVGGMRGVPLEAARDAAAGVVVGAALSAGVVVGAALSAAIGAVASGGSVGERIGVGDESTRISIRVAHLGRSSCVVFFLVGKSLFSRSAKSSSEEESTYYG